VSSLHVPVQAVLTRVPVYSRRVLAYEFMVLLLCKALSAVGFKQFTTIGV
jgi:hypothetical protein